MMRYNQLINYFILTLTAVLFFICYVRSEKQPIVTTPLGKIEGYYMKTREEKKINAFTSIPFAYAPIRDLRFKAPVPIDPWAGTLNGTKPTPQCVQRNPYTRQKEIVGQEDCLYLNIYTPDTSNDHDHNGQLLPVMVFFHGGGWMCGDSSTSMYGPEYLLDHPVILVTVNYRLGPLGFLSTQDKHCPGNNGLKDQQEALRFIQKTITSFGGNKDAVTIFGESAGGASVHFHMLSKTSIGLFHRAISESGTALVPWAEAPPREGLRNAFKLAKYLDCPPSPSEDMLRCLQTKECYEIIDTEFKFYDWDYEPMTPFKAVVEPDLPGAFLNQSARKVNDIPAVPWLTGLTKDEGCLKSVWITSNETRYKEFISGFDIIAPVTFYYENSPYVDTITSKLKDTYLQENSDESIKRGILEMYTDSYFAYPAVEAVEQTFTYSKSPIYLYELVYRGSNSFSQIFGDPDGDYGVCHAEELMYLFPIHFLNNPVTEKDIEVGKRIRTIWTNFATSGDPNKPVPLSVKWEPATRDKMEYFEIGAEDTMKENFASRSRVWGKLPLWHNMRRQRFIDEL